MTTELKNQFHREDQPSGFTENYVKTCQKLAERQELSEEVVSEAMQIMDETSTSFQQHYKPKHMAAGTLAIASRMKGQPRTVSQLTKTLNDMNGLFENKKHLKEVRRAMKKLKKSNNIDLNPVLAEEFVETMENLMGLHESLKEECVELCESARRKPAFYGKSQMALAGASIHVISRNSKQFDEVGAVEIAEVAGTNPKTLKDAARQLRKNLEHGIKTETRTKTDKGDLDE